MARPEDSTLVTGFPSMLARRVVRAIAARGDRVLMLAQQKFADAAQELGRALAAEGLPGPVSVLVGDVMNLDLGLSGKELKRVSRDVRRIHHAAGISFAGAAPALVERVNVEGTRNLLDVAAELGDIERVVVYSTAFVAGDRTGVVMEADLEAGQHFRSAFESSKYEAERVARNRMSALPICVVRPSLVVGDSVTGEVDRLDGPYALVRWILSAPADLHLPLGEAADHPLNVVPVDFVAAAAEAIGRAPAGAGRTFHLTDPNPLPVHAFVAEVMRAAGRRADRDSLPSRLFERLSLLPLVGERILPQGVFLRDHGRPTVFNCANAIEALAGSSIRCPPFPSYAGAIVRHTRARIEAEASARAARNAVTEDEDAYS